MKENKLAKASSILFILNMAASVLNYLCQLLMARTLSVASFGTINTIFSFMLIAAVPGTTLTMIVARYYAGIGENACSDEKQSYMCSTFKKVSVLTITTFLMFLVLIIPLGQLLVIDNSIVLVMVFLLAALGFYQPLYSGVFTGNKYFVWVGLYSLLIPLYKILSVIVAQTVTEIDIYRLYTVLLIMIIGTIVTAFIGHWKTFSILGKFSLSKEQVSVPIFAKDDLYTLILNVCLMIYMNIDLLSVRYYGTDNESGLYSAVLLFGRVAYYFSTTLGTILLPAAANQKAIERNKVKVLNKALLLLAVFSAICIIPLNIGKSFFIKLLYGEAYLGAVPYVKYVCIISVALSICTILTNYLVGIGRTKLATVVMILVNITVLLFAYFAKDISTILRGIGIIGMAGALVIYLACLPREVKKHESKPQ